MQRHIFDAVKPREALGHNVKPSLHSRCEALMMLAVAENERVCRGRKGLRRSELARRLGGRP